MDEKEFYMKLSDICYVMIGYISMMEKYPSLHKYSKELEQLLNKREKELFAKSVVSTGKLK